MYILEISIIYLLENHRDTTLSRILVFCIHTYNRQILISTLKPVIRFHRQKLVKPLTDQTGFSQSYPDIWIFMVFFWPYVDVILLSLSVKIINGRISDALTCVSFCSNVRFDWMVFIYWKYQFKDLVKDFGSFTL